MNVPTLVAMRISRVGQSHERWDSRGSGYEDADAAADLAGGPNLSPCSVNPNSLLTEEHFARRNGLLHLDVVLLFWF